MILTSLSDTCYLGRRVSWCSSHSLMKWHQLRNIYQKFPYYRRTLENTSIIYRWTFLKRIAVCDVLMQSDDGYGVKFTNLSFYHTLFILITMVQPANGWGGQCCTSFQRRKTRLQCINSHQTRMINIGRRQQNGTEPVSYTHLDVYKRQHLDSVMHRQHLNCLLYTSRCV